MKCVGTLLGILLLVQGAGCSLPTGILRSRWAMDDPDYAEKYAEGAPKHDVLGKAKQAVDARFVEGASGKYVSVGTSAWANSDSVMGGGEIGTESYVTSFLTYRGDLALFMNEEDAYVGVNLGTRLQVPSRIAPFAGAGLFAGYAEQTVVKDDDGYDNDEDGFIDERGEEDEELSGAIAAIYPEVGIHAWWNPNVRLTLYSRYLMTTDGRDSDGWLLGGGIAVFSK